MIRGQPRHRSPPELRGGQHVRLVDRGEPPGARFGPGKRVPGHALDFSGCVDSLIGGPFATRIALHPVLAEINVAGEFADKIDVHMIGPGPGQRRKASQRRAQIDRAKIDVKPQLLPQPEQAAFRPPADRERVPARAAHRPQKDGVSGKAGRERFRGKRFSGGVDGAPAKRVFGELEPVAELVSAVLKYMHRHLHDFRANAIARQKNDLPGLTGHHFSLWLSLPASTICPGTQVGRGTPGLAGQYNPLFSSCQSLGGRPHSAATAVWLPCLRKTWCAMVSKARVGTVLDSSARVTTRR